MKKALDKAMIVSAPFFSACASFAGMFVVFLSVRKDDPISFLAPEWHSAYQILISIGLIWFSFYFLVWAVIPKERYREALSHFSKSILVTACIGLVLSLSLPALIDYFYWKILPMFVSVSIFAGIGLCIVAVIPVLLFETFLHASVIADIGKISVWKSLLLSFFLLLVLPVLIVFGMAQIGGAFK